MGFKWSSEKVENKEKENIEKKFEGNVSLTGCNVYFSVDLPTCTNRSKKKLNKEQQVCWEIIRDLRYNGKGYIYKDKNVNVCICKTCGEYFVFECFDDECLDEERNDYECILCKEEHI